MNWKCPNCKSKDYVLVEYDWRNPEHYDGISEILCLKCKKRYGRWCNTELEEKELEPVFCENKHNQRQIVHL